MPRRLGTRAVWRRRAGRGSVARAADPVARELYLFGETQGCAWGVVPEEHLNDLLALAQELGCMARGAGTIGGDRIVVRDAHQLAMLDLPVSEARGAWTHGFADALGLSQPPDGL